MSWLVLAGTALREIVAHKFRSALSMLGIVLGVSSLIATTALTTGIERGTRAFMEQVGGLEFVRVINKEISAANAEFWNLSPGRTLRDVEAIRSLAPLISHISPEMGHGVTLVARGVTDRFVAHGVWPDHFEVARHELAAGRVLVDLDVARATRAVVIGDAIRRQFFPDKEPAEVVGEVLTANGAPFVVVGVLTRYEREEDRRARELAKASGRQQTAPTPVRGRRPGRWDPFRGKNESILIPLSTMFHEFKAGLVPLDALESVRLDNLNLRVSDLSQFRQALEQVRGALEITRRGVDDFDLETREEWFGRMEASVASTRLSGWLIAGISLVVGGIGIANIMLASISERIREIGVRLAVGARGRDIFLQILTEGLAVSLLGGMLGVAAGVGFVHVLGIVAPSENTPFIEPTALVWSVGFAALAGVVAGVYPALRASRLDPISALRYE